MILDTTTSNLNVLNGNECMKIIEEIPCKDS